MHEMPDRELDQPEEIIRHEQSYDDARQNAIDEKYAKSVTDSVVDVIKDIAK